MIGPGEEQLERTHRDLRVPWMASCAIAVIAPDIRRLTSDVDVAIGGAEIGALITAGDRGSAAATIALARRWR